MKNKKGFTLVELLVTIVIMGIISTMSFPLIRRVQEQNEKTKYSTYGDSMVAAAKLYVDTFEEDLFYYEDDSWPSSLNFTENWAYSGKTQCALITLEQLNTKKLIDDINMDKISCMSDYSFVVVKRKGMKYEYQFYLGCGPRKGTSKLNKVSLQLPTEHKVGVTGNGTNSFSKLYCSEI